jgi:hypothetical protein
MSSEKQTLLIEFFIIFISEECPKTRTQYHTAVTTSQAHTACHFALVSVGVRQIFEPVSSSILATHYGNGAKVLLTIYVKSYLQSVSS